MVARAEFLVDEVSLVELRLAVHGERGRRIRVRTGVAAPQGDEG